MPKPKFILHSRLVSSEPLLGEALCFRFQKQSVRTGYDASIVKKRLLICSAPPTGSIHLSVYPSRNGQMQVQNYEIFWELKPKTEKT